MLETMMKPGGYRVEYFHRPNVAVTDRLAFYVRGELENGAAYSMHARLHMLAGFQVIMTELGLRRLVAVYLDIAQCDQVVRPAYDQMKSDLLAGVFCQLFVFRVADLAPCPAVLDELSSLRSQVPAFEILAFDTVKQTVQRFDDEQANRVHLE